ncbi:hypothetical protein EDD86DRAFT_199516 [Gorgonomyces haynaldii]|nr:hypothetical protein EDD86DRAFT_199516 [Gorgonomyces haynaldii]
MTSQRDIVDHLFPGFLTHLTTLQGFHEHKILLKPSITPDASLPTELAALYLITNGFDIQWSVMLANSFYQVGSIKINSYIDASSTNYWILDQDHFGHVLMQDDGKILYRPLYHEPIELCNSLSHYLRLSYVYLGIPGWQMGFTPFGCPPSARDWLTFYCACPQIQRYTKERRNENGPKEAAKRKAWSMGIPSDTCNWWSSNTSEFKAKPFNWDTVQKMVRSIKSNDKIVLQQ